jgi:hypothetical protein
VSRPVPTRMAGLALAVGLASLALAGCPLPQPLAEVGRVDGGSVTTPIILPETAVPPDAILYVSRACPSSPSFPLSATLDDLDTSEVVEARWFVDYDPSSGLTSTPQLVEAAVQPAADPADPSRQLTPYGFEPYRYGTAVPLHVVEVVVSNGFLPVGDATAPRNRAAVPGFLTQSFRWTFQLVDAGDARGRCGG